MAGYRTAFGDSYCGPGSTWVEWGDGGGICLPDYTTSPVNPPSPVPPPIDWGQVIMPPPIKPPSAGVFPLPPMVNAPGPGTGGNPFASSSGGLWLLIGGAALLFMTMKGGKR